MRMRGGGMKRVTLANPKLGRPGSAVGKTGFYQTRLANVYRGSGMFLRGGSVRSPTARLRRRRGKGLQLKGGGMQMKGGGFWDAFIAPARWMVDGISNTKYMKDKRAARASRRQAQDDRIQKLRDNLASKRGGMNLRGGGLRLRGGGLVRGPGKGQRIQRRARVI